MTTPNPATLCPGCFKETGGGNPCPHCGFDAQAPRPAKTLAPHTLLHGQFLVGRVLGKPGGFGITYLGWDLGLHRRVAIKEYFPRDIAGRDGDRTTVTPDSTDDAEGFRYGLEQFQAEARTLARLDHPNIVRIHQVLAAHGTAYLVMEYYPGLTLAEHLDRQPGSRLPEATALALMQQILDGLRAVHAEGLLHRDIKPQNIYLAATRGGNARPVLIDFGAARQVAGERSRSLSVLLTPGYAPLEQYSRRGHQGPWTDVYAVAAVLYRMLTGSAPPDAHDRTQGEPLPPAARFGVSATVSAALDRALAMAAGERPQSVVELQRALAGAAGEVAVEKGQGPNAPPPARPRPGGEAGRATPPPRTGGLGHWFWIGGLAGLVALAAGVNYFVFVAPSAALPADLARVHTEALALAQTDQARQTLERYYNAGQVALRDQDKDGAKLALAELDAARIALGQEYRLRIVNRAGEQSGVWRIPDLNTKARNYYIIVEAVDPAGPVLTVPVENEETKRIEHVKAWGLRVDQGTFEAVARDKRDDGVIERDRFGYKARGTLVPEYEMQTTGGAITVW
ncbi:DUF6384 family protein [Lamprocystis purpurea]|uniref:DUF6384 family protein n=1 Tax=Lamprocystis purpurea TaxID=61598 RepID=UPI00038095A8|nr:DUF6384 family protein [Lamprocystis purpurea]